MFTTCGTQVTSSRPTAGRPSRTWWRGWATTASARLPVFAGSVPRRTCQARFNARLSPCRPLS